MQQNALIVHAWLSSTNDHWYQWLKTELTNKGYTVYLPEIPTMNSQAPNLQTQMDFYRKRFLSTITLLYLAIASVAYLHYALQKNTRFKNISCRRLGF